MNEILPDVGRQACSISIVTLISNKVKLRKGETNTEHLVCIFEENKGFCIIT